MPEHPVAPPVVRFDREVVLLLRPVALVVAVVVLGVAGYMVLERWSLLDALYMVITTLTTVGYGEIRPLTPWGRAFTMVIIVLGVGTMLYTLTTLVQYAVEGGLERRLVRGRMQQQIDRLTEHVILCGYGRVGRQVAQEFQRERVPLSWSTAMKLPSPEPRPTGAWSSMATPSRMTSCSPRASGAHASW